MAFTLDEQAQIRLYLGYPDIFRYQNTRLEGVIAVDGALHLEAEAVVRTALANLVNVENAILNSGIARAGLKRVDEIEFFASRTLTELRRWGRMYAGRISITLGVPIYSDVFGDEGYLGDKYSAGGLGAPERGRNVIPVG